MDFIYTLFLNQLELVVLMMLLLFVIVGGLIMRFVEGDLVDNLEYLCVAYAIIIISAIIVNHQAHTTTYDNAVINVESVAKSNMLIVTADSQEYALYNEDDIDVDVGDKLTLGLLANGQWKLD